MPIRVKCPNSDCGVTLKVKDALAGRAVKCPRCGTRVQVPAGASAAAPAGAAAPQKPEESNGAYNPARQECPQCGAILGVRVTFCPKCGADIRTGEVAETKTKKGFDITPFIKLGAALVVLVLVIGGIVFALTHLLSSKKTKEEPETPVSTAQAAGEPGQEAPQAPPIWQGFKREFAKPRKRPEKIAAEVIESVPDEEKRICQAAEAYFEKLREVLSALEQSSDEQMAARWADLYAFCKQNGLKKEAERCWLRAVFLRPRSAPTNRILGRTGQFRGVPVTPEQARFLDSLAGHVTVTNYHPKGNGMQVAIDGGAPVALPREQSLERRTSSDVVNIRVMPGPDSGESQTKFKVNAWHGFHCVVKLKPRDPGGPMPYLDLKLLWDGYEKWRENASQLRDEKAAPPGQFKKTIQGWKIMLLPPTPPSVSRRMRPKARAVYLLTGPDGTLRELRTGKVALCGAGSASPKITKTENSLRMHGILSLYEKKGGLGSAVAYYGDATAPVAVAMHEAATMAFVRQGAQYCIERELDPSLLGVLGAMDGDIAAWARLSALNKQEEVFLQESRDLEAAGELRGRWEAELKIDAQMAEPRRRTRRILELQDKAWEYPHSRDRCAAIGLADRTRYLYLNWPRFQTALRRLAATAPAALVRQVAKVGTFDASQFPTRPTMMGGGGGMGAGTPGGMMAPSTPGRGRTSAAPGEPDICYLLKALNIMPDAVALREIQRHWEHLDEKDQVRALRALETMNTREAIEYTGYISESAGTEETVMHSLLSLGQVGTPQALGYFRTPPVIREVRAAWIAGLCLAGRLAVVDALPETLKKAQPITRTIFLDLLTEMDSAGSILALSKAIDFYSDTTSQAKIADALLRMGGHASMYELARLVDKGVQITPEILARIEPEEGLLLLRPLGKVAAGSGQGSMEAAIHLAHTGEDFAITQLKAAAVNSNSRAAVAGLAITGKKDPLYAASSMYDLLDVPTLKLITQHWRKKGAATQVWTWNDGVDRKAAVDFLDYICRSSKDDDMVLTTAEQLLQMGQTPDQLTLLSIASRPLPPPPAPPGAPTAPTGPGTPGMGPAVSPPPPTPQPSAPAPAPGVPGAAQQEQDFTPYPGYQELAIGEEHDTKLEKKPPSKRGRARRGRRGRGTTKKKAPPKENPRFRALDLLARMADKSTSEALREMVEKTNNRQIRFKAQRVLGYIGGTEEVAFLRERLAADEAAKTPQELVESLEKRLIAAYCLGIAGDTELVPVIDSMLNEALPKELEQSKTMKSWWEVNFWAGAAKALARLCMKTKVSEIVSDTEMHDRMMARLLGLIDRPGPNIPAIYSARIKLRVQAIRGISRLGLLSHHSSIALLNRLALKFGKRETPAARMPQVPPPGGPPGEPGQPRVKPEPEQPFEVNVAVLDAVVEIADRTVTPTLLKKLPRGLAGSGGLTAHWNRLAVRLAEKANPADFQLLNYTFLYLEPDVVKKIVPVASAQTARHCEPYYGLLSLVASVELEGNLDRSPEDLMRAQMHMGGRPPGIQPGMPGYAGPAKPRYLALMEQERRRQHWEQYDKPKEKDQWLQDCAFKWHCVELLARGPANVVCPIMEEPVLYAKTTSRRRRGRGTRARKKFIKGALVAHQHFGPAIALIIKEKSPSFDIAKYLDDAVWEQNEEQWRGAVAAARKVGGQAASEVLDLLLLGPEMTMDDGQPGAGMQPGGGDDMEKTFVPSPYVQYYAARALGSLGNTGILQMAATGKAKNRMAGEGAVRCAYEGMSYLGREHDPVAVLTTIKKKRREASRARAAASKTARTPSRRSRAFDASAGLVTKEVPLNQALDNAIRLVIKRTSGR